VPRSVIVVKVESVYTMSTKAAGRACDRSYPPRLKETIY
jgi:hypothetical protein